MNYSVLMSVYFKEKPEYLRQSMNSIFDQSVPTDDFVLVCDGPLNTELDAVIEEMLQRHPKTLHVVRLEKNAGLGNALNDGIKCCKNDIVARMDSDDIARPDRCERQLAVFAQNPEIGMVSGIVEEFTNDPSIVEAKRVPPEKHEDILEFAKKRNPFNHPCMMYKKDEVEKAGGYQELFLLEDYFLWVRMLLKGTHGYNLQEPLLWMRAGAGMYKRRSGWKYIQAQIRLFSYMKCAGMIKSIDWLQSVIVRTVSGMAPNTLRRLFFVKILRK